MLSVLRCCVFCLCWAALVHAQPSFATLPRRILIFDQGDFTGPYKVAHTLAIRAALTEHDGQHIEIYTEGLDMDRFPGREHEERLARWLSHKYRDRTIDVLVAEGPEALDFLIKFRAAYWPGIPIVFSAIESYYISRMALPENVTGVSLVAPINDSVQLASRVLAGTKRIVILGDDESQGGYLVEVFREFIQINLKRELNVMTGMPIASILGSISSLPQDSAILYLGITNDSTGQYFLPHALLGTIARKANRPIFVTNDYLIGSGAVGGLVVKAADGAAEVAGMIRRILDGENASDIPVAFLDRRKPIFDARALARWNIPREALPAGSELLYYEPTLWEKYSYQIVLVVAALILQALLIVALIIEYRRRRRVELEFRRSMTNFAHLNRATALGELTASIAHELNQPLGAMQINAESAEKLLGAIPPAIGQAKAAVSSILRDNQRASDIIKSIRSLFRKSDPEWRPIEINAVAEEVVAFARWEAQAKGIEIGTRLADGLPPVLADRIQLEQVMLNLVMNAIEALQQVPQARRKVTVETAKSLPNNVVIAVEDSGPGIPETDVEQIFAPYYTTKTHGMGMGLSISRTIVETLGSRLVVRNLDGGGARFEFVLGGVEP